MRVCLSLSLAHRLTFLGLLHSLLLVSHVQGRKQRLTLAGATEKRGQTNEQHLYIWSGAKPHTFRAVVIRRQQ